MRTKLYKITGFFLAGGTLLLLVFAVIPAMGKYATENNNKPAIDLSTLSQTSNTLTAEDILKLVNEERTKKAYIALKRDSLLDKAAESIFNDMVSKKYWSVTAPGETQWYAFVTKAGYQYGNAAMDLAKDSNNASTVVYMWMNSKQDKENILNSYFEDIGIFVKEGSTSNSQQGLIVVQIIANKKVQKTVQPNQNSNTTYISTDPKIDCIGPDGKHFQTTQKECDDFDSAWKKQNISTVNSDAITNCQISPNCGGGTKQTTKSNCESMICCQVKNDWKLLERTECKRQQCDVIYGLKDDSYHSCSSTNLFDCMDGIDARIKKDMDYCMSK